MPVPPASCSTSRASPSTAVDAFEDPPRIVIDIAGDADRRAPPTPDAAIASAPAPAPEVPATRREPPSEARARWRRQPRRASPAARGRRARRRHPTTSRSRDQGPTSGRRPPTRRPSRRGEPAPAPAATPKRTETRQQTKATAGSEPLPGRPANRALADRARSGPRRRRSRRARRRRPPREGRHARDRAASEAPLGGVVERARCCSPARPTHTYARRAHRLRQRQQRRPLRLDPRQRRPQRRLCRASRPTRSTTRTTARRSASPRWRTAPRCGVGRGDLSFILSDMVQSGKEEESNALAERLHSRVLARLRSRYTDVHNLGVKKGPFYVLVGAYMPCVLVETSFLSHPDRGEAARHDAPTSTTSPKASTSASRTSSATRGSRRPSELVPHAMTPVELDARHPGARRPVHARAAQISAPSPARTSPTCGRVLYAAAPRRRRAVGHRRGVHERASIA